MLSSDASSNYYGYGLEATGVQITVSDNLAYNLGQVLSTSYCNGAGQHRDGKHGLVRPPTASTPPTPVVIGIIGVS